MDLFLLSRKHPFGSDWLSHYHQDFCIQILFATTGTIACFHNRKTAYSIDHLWSHFLKTNTVHSFLPVQFFYLLFLPSNLSLDLKFE
ncbi:hypothetical protein D3C87_1389080 [compost metagenome]